MINCEFSSPVNLIGEIPGETELWNFSEMICSSSQFEEIPFNEGFLFFDNSIGIGDILIIYFLLFFLLGFIFNFIFKLVYPRYMRYINKKFLK